MAHYCPGPQTQQHSAGTALPGAEGTLQLSVPAQLGTAQGGRAILWLPGLHGPGQRKLPQSSQGRQCRTTNKLMAGLPLLRLQTGRGLPGQPPNNGNLGPTAERGAVWELEPAASTGMQSQRGEHTAETNVVPPRSLQLQQLSFQPVAPEGREGSRCRRHSSSLNAYPDPAVPATLQEGWSRGWRAISHWPREGKAHLFRLFKFGTHRTYHSNALEAKGFGFFFSFSLQTYKKTLCNSHVHITRRKQL